VCHSLFWLQISYRAIFDDNEHVLQLPLMTGGLKPMTVDEHVLRGLNSVIWGAWALRSHRNHCVFDGISPFQSNVSLALEEMRFWSLAGA
jgi:hypothetical protein